jgi:hypothetical protein
VRRFEKSARLSGCGTNGCLARWGNSRSPIPPPRARPVIQGVVENGYALIVFSSNTGTQPPPKNNDAQGRTGAGEPGSFNARGSGSGLRMAPQALPARWLTDEVTRLPTATSVAWVEAGGGLGIAEPQAFSPRLCRRVCRRGGSRRAEARRNRSPQYLRETMPRVPSLLE